MGWNSKHSTTNGKPKQTINNNRTRVASILIDKLKFNFERTTVNNSFRTFNMKLFAHQPLGMSSNKPSKSSINSSNSLFIFYIFTEGPARISFPWPLGNPRRFRLNPLLLNNLL